MVKTKEQPIWNPYPEFPFIEANQFGEIRMIDRVVKGKDGKKYHIKGHVLKQRLRPDGYMDIQFQVNGKKVLRLVHRIMATCFIPNPNNLPEVNHIDNDRTNNSVSNLEWCTRQYNQDYKKNFGTSQAQLFGRPVIAVNPKTGEVLWFESQHEAARQLGVYQQNISAVINGKRHRTTGGCWFCYADENAVEKTREKFGDEIAEKVEELMKECSN